MTDLCPRCQAPIRWVRTDENKEAMTQIDTAPDKHGAWVIDAVYHGDQRIEYVRVHWPLIDGDKPRYSKHICTGAAA